MHAGTMIHLRGFPCRLNKVIYRMPGPQWKIIKANSSAISFSLSLFIHSLTHSTRAEHFSGHAPALGWLLVRSHPIPPPHSLLLCAVPQRAWQPWTASPRLPCPLASSWKHWQEIWRVGGGRSWTIYPALHLLHVSTWGW